MTFDERHDDFGDEPVFDILERETRRELERSVAARERADAESICVEFPSEKVRRGYRELGPLRRLASVTVAAFRAQHMPFSPDAKDERAAAARLRPHSADVSNISPVTKRDRAVAPAGPVTGT
jgi:hypothetical protein